MRRHFVAQAGAVAAALLCVGAALATTTSDRSASIVVYPKIVYDSVNNTDTIIQISNTSPSQAIQAHCFYVNANSHCTNTGLPCQSGLECGVGGACVSGWSEIDFYLSLTRDQPFFWVASTGRNRTCASASDPADQCLPLPYNGLGTCSNGFGVCQTAADCGGAVCLGAGLSNAGTAVPPVPEDPFVGELKCVQVSSDGTPVAGDDLIGEATIVTNGEPVNSEIDAQEYNAIGMQADGHCFDAAGDGGGSCVSDSDCDPEFTCTFNGDRTLTIGGDFFEREYQSCPSTLILDHIFDGAPDPIDGAPTVTDLTLVPCSENFSIGISDLGRSTAQFLVFNEFEQRFSTSLPVTCFEEILLSNIDTRNNARSIFSVGVSGTIAGQSRIRPVGSGLLGIARVMKIGSFPPAVPGPDVRGVGAAYNLHQQGERNDVGLEDRIVLP